MRKRRAQLPDDVNVDAGNDEFSFRGAVTGNEASDIDDVRQEASSIAEDPDGYIEQLERR